MSIANLFSDKYNGNSTDTDDQFLESIKNLNLGPLDVPIDYGISAMTVFDEVCQWSGR